MNTTDPNHPLTGSRRTRTGGQLLLAVLVIATAVVVFDAAAYATDITSAAEKPKSIEEVVNSLRNWLIGILAAVATFFLTYGGVRYICAGGNPGEVEKAKSALKSAGIGYGLALLAPLIVSVIKDVLK